MKRKVVALLLTIALVFTMGASVMAEPAGTEFLDTIDWAAEYDVVVIGYGLAGAMASVTAANAGASVLMVEKAAKGQEGGNSRYAGQCIYTMNEDNRDGLLEYLKALRGEFDTPSDAVLEAMADGLVENGKWLQSLVPEDKWVAYPHAEFPEYPGGEGGYMMLYEGEFFTGKWYRFFQNLVNEVETGLDIWYETPATHLIQDKATGIIHGVLVEHDGKEYAIRAKNGVVMAMGGFENNQIMLQNFAQISDGYSKGAHFNTGDGIKMAIEVGANIWHMSTLSGPDVNFVNPETKIAAGYSLSNTSPAPWATGFLAYDVIYIGEDATRFCNETIFPDHGHTKVGGTPFSIHIPENAYCIFDEDARVAGSKAYYSWSDGMVDEIEKGWVVKADTLEELAEKTGHDPEALISTVENYNAICEAGVDSAYGRPQDYLKPIDTAPFYGFKLSPTLTNTQGGAERNENCEVVTPFGEAIPHLYSAGEFGSFFADVYQGGCNMSECVFTGRVAGTNAAAAKDDTVDISVMEGKTPVDFSVADTEYTVEANEYLGTGYGIGGKLILKVTIEDQKITAIEPELCNETGGLGDVAVAKVSAEIIEAQNTEVDTMTGATVSSKATIEAVKDAMAQAGL